MHATIRTYRINTNYSSEAIRRVLEELAPQLVEKVPGLLEYYVLDGGDGVLATVTICDGEDGLEECSKIATEWTKQYLVQSILEREDLSGMFLDVEQPLEGLLYKGATQREATDTKFPEEEEEELAHQEASASLDSQDLQLLSVEEVCEVLGMGKVWVYRQIRNGQIPSVRLGRSVKVKRADLDRYVQNNRAHELTS